ncbi:MAG: hypothetical protein ACYCO4_07335 [Sulfobacillus sp.]
MADLVRVALDGYGGDRGLATTTEGALLALADDLSLEVLLVGDGKPASSDQPRLHPVPSAGALPDGGHPAHLLRVEPDLSVGLAAQLVQRHQADAFVSAGHTGATMIAARWAFGTFPEVNRIPAGTTLPLPMTNPPLLLDMGANARVRGSDLAVFAALGVAYMQAVRNIPRPRVALLCNGVEEGKGTPEIADARARLQDSGLNFVGYVEPVDIPAGGVDVLVAEGFVGNVMIKWMEGLATLISSLTDQLAEPAASWMRGYLRPMQDITQSLDPLLLLGVRAVAVPGHGRSEPQDIARLIRHAAQAVRGHLVDHISESLGQLSPREV